MFIKLIARLPQMFFLNIQRNKGKERQIEENREKFEKFMRIQAVPVSIIINLKIEICKILFLN